MQRACAGFVLYRIYQDMFARGRQERLTHAIVFDEAHRAGRLKLLPTMAKECRKYGLALIVASQEARDGAIASGMEQGMEAGYKQLDALLAQPA